MKIIQKGDTFKVVLEQNGHRMVYELPSPQDVAGFKLSRGRSVSYDRSVSSDARNLIETSTHPGYFARVRVCEPYRT